VLQRWIGRVIFRRQNLDDRVRSITQLSSKARSEDDLLSGAAREIAAHLRTDQSAVVAELGKTREADQPAVLFGGQRISHLPAELFWAEAQLPLRFSSGEVRFVLTGPRRGRQRYLSEDLEDMRRLGSVIVEQVERFRSEELKRLATQAELRALQAQINPHFLFNALNTLYGSIDRSSYDARRMVLNLAEIFRYFLQGDRSFIPLSEELRIVQAYLEIEALRLGDRLETKLEIDEPARSVMIPVLSIQPLVENAVKHGIATKQGRGRITLRARKMEGSLRVTVEDTGLGFEASNRQSREGTGVGLDNVRRRLKLSYGPDASLDISSNGSGSTVSFMIPITGEQAAMQQEIVVGA
jgi:sensor histidine kinase YesM